MASVITLRDLTPLDILVVRDLVRFGVLTTDQIERRYHHALLASIQLPLLVAGGFARPLPRLVQDTSVFAATPDTARIARCGLRALPPSLDHLRHDIAVTDLADYLVDRDPQADFRTERELGRSLRIARRLRTPGLPTGRGHRPDGLLIQGDKRIAIELEHTDKGDQRYVDICRWFALAVRLDAVHWYVDDPRIVERLNRINAQHGYGRDIEVQVEPFPAGVAVRSWVRE